MNKVRAIIREVVSNFITEVEGLSFPTDYDKRESRVKYLYQMGAMRPNGVNDDWYESKTIERKYRDIPVKMKHQLNMDQSERGWRIVDLGFDGDRIYAKDSNSNLPQTDEVRGRIDQYYNEFAQFMNGIQTDGDELEKAIQNLETRSGRQVTRREESPIDTAIRWMLAGGFNMITKRKLLKQLMEQGLPIEDAISFWREIK